jgi:site-specific recombinase XerD
VLVHLLLDQGLRLAEVLALDHGDVSGSRNAKRLRVVRHGKSTNVIVDTAGSKSIHELEQYAPKPGPLFTGPSRGRRDPSRLTRFGADHLIKQAAATAGIGWSVSANVLRRTHVTHAQRTGVPIGQIGEAMGHRDLRSTRRYLTPINTNNRSTS